MRYKAGEFVKIHPVEVLQHVGCASYGMLKWAEKSCTFVRSTEIGIVCMTTLGSFWGMAGIGVTV